MSGKTKKPAIIALLTDFRYHNWYLGVMKGVILGINPQVRIIDLCHNVSANDVREGSFILGNSFMFFPPGTIFLCVVDPGVGGKRKNLIVETENYYFVAPDNGILSSIFEKGKVRRVLEIKTGKYTRPLQGSTFYGRDIFAPVATHLSLGVSPDDIGKELKSVLTVPALKPFINKKGEVSGRAVYVDTFGNIITNIREEYIQQVFGEDVQYDDLSLRLHKRKVKGIKKYYQQGKDGKLMALFDSWGYLEIAVNRGSAYDLLGLTEKKSLEIFLFGKEPLSPEKE
ncbi:MAG: SAM-dependent chlorinase/fluorinase [Candidatus Krumholzibacteriota bacterium]|nr:SAM-dependent chlorinase/fluorinase [Candidatus Krumholzibacteriota bacterium]